MSSIQYEYNKALNKTLSSLFVFNVAVYVRLSKAEEGKSKEEQSRSIINQKNICISFLNNLIESDKSIIKYNFINYYVDDGISGSTFDRPSFKKLKSDIKLKKINMVIIKDLSRLGREHIETDNYLEKWFPQNDTRCISILDNIDTFSESSNNEIAPILNWANERYNRETSKKIKKTFRENIISGLYMGSEPPYGFIKGKTNNTRHKLFVDEEVRNIIIDIFEKAKQEWSLNKIADYLTNKNVPIPSVHKNSNRGIITKTYDIWKPKTIKSILTNEMYIGNMVQGKTTRLNLKSKKITYIPKEDWVVVKNTHEAIIEKETFFLVQDILNQRVHKKKNNNFFLLKGLLICKECGHSLGIQQNNNCNQVYTVCNYYKKYSKYNLCSSHRFNYEIVEKEIIESIKELYKKYFNFSIFIDKIKEKKDNKIKELDVLIKKSENNIIKYKKQIDITYMDKLNNIIDEETFINIKNSLDKRIIDEETVIDKLNKILNNLIENDRNNYDGKKFIDKYLLFDNIDRNTILQLIKRIEINQDGIIYIYYKTKPLL